MLSVSILVKNMVEVIGFFGYSLPCLIFVPFWFLVSCGAHRAACGGWWGNEARGDRWRQVVEHVVRNDWTKIAISRAWTGGPVGGNFIALTVHFRVKCC